MKMKIKNVLVNWSLYDEELLEPYEWKEDDDLELIDEINLIRVDELCLNDLFNNIVTISMERTSNEFIVANETYAIAIELDHNGHLKYRSVLTYDKRNEIGDIIKTLPTHSLLYTVQDYCENKEYGLTRAERIKKQYLVQKIELLYQYQPRKLLSIYTQLYLIEESDPNKAYKRILKQLKSGYLNYHEYLYKLLYLI